MRRIFVILLLFCGARAQPNSNLFSTHFENNVDPLNFITALGRIPQPGDLYERGRDLISPDSLFKNPLLEDKIMTNSIPETSSSFRSQGMTFTEMAAKMRLSMEQKLSIALGITKVTGSASFLTAALGRSPNPTGNTCVHSSTITRGFSLWDKDVSQLVSLETLEKTNATDLIISVKYGLEACYNHPPEPSSKNAGQFVNVTWSSSLVERSPDFVCPPGMMDREPLALSEKEVNRKLSQLKLKSSTNFGEPIAFELLPLSKVRKHLNVQEKDEIPYNEVPAYLSGGLVETAEALHKVKKDLSEFWNRTLCHSMVISESKLSLLKLSVDSWLNNITAGIAKMAEVVTLYRNGSATRNNLTTAIDQFSGLLSELGLNYRSIERKINVQFPFLAEYKRLADGFTLARLKFIANANIFHQLMSENTTFFVLKYKLDWIKANRTEWNKLKSVLLNTEVEGNWIRKPDKYVLDCDILPKYCVNVTKIEVKIHEGSLSQKNALAFKYLKVGGSLISSRLPRITNNSTMDELIRGKKTFVVLKFKLPWILENPEDWEQLRSIFMNYRGMWSWFGNPDKYLMDCDLLPEHCENVTKIVVNRYNAGQLEGTGDYLCAISKSFLNLQEQNPYGAFRASWVIEEPFKEPYKPCRTKRVLTKYQGAFWDHDLEIIV